MRPAVFLDRDGVINDVVWRDGKPASPRTEAEFILAPQAVATVGRLRADGYMIFIVTNQPDIRRGLMDPCALDAMHETLLRTMPIDAIRACRHDDRDACACRKPQPGMLLDLARVHDVALDRSWMIGDQDRDMECGRAAGCGTIQLMRSYNTGRQTDHRVATLADGADLLLRLNQDAFTV